MKYVELKEKALPDLYETLVSLKREQLVLRLQAKSNQLADTSRIKMCRRSVARVLSRIGEVKRQVQGS